MQVDSDYNLIERLVHWLALEFTFVRELSFDVERLFFSPKQNINDKQILASAEGAVYVCGLARSGTTILLHILDEIKVFRSQTYRDMPFVLAPNLWKMITQHDNSPAIAEMRAHGDNLMVHFDSPEGFEEVFWRTFSKINLDKQCFDAEEPTLDALVNFADYRALIANPKSSFPNSPTYRYLSKNNNNLLRLNMLSRDPTATLLLVYRDPIATARSLYNQHQRFSTAHATDDFTRHYMRWLGHHEFGLDHLPFCFAVPEMDATLSSDNPNYWLNYWNAVYLHVLAQAESPFYLVNYDVLCHEPELMLESIFLALDVEADGKSLALNIRPASAESALPDEFEPDWVRRAQQTHHQLLCSTKNITPRSH